MGKAIWLVIDPGARFCMLEVIKSAYHRNTAVWKCKCDCGRFAYVTGSNLRRGQKSCGCLIGRPQQDTEPKKTKEIKAEKLPPQQHDMCGEKK